MQDTWLSVKREKMTLNTHEFKSSIYQPFLDPRSSMKWVTNIIYKTIINSRVWPSDLYLNIAYM